MPHRVHRPHILDDEECDPLPVADVYEICSAEDERSGVDDKKTYVEQLLMPRNRLVVGDVVEEFLEVHRAATISDVEDHVPIIRHSVL
jgi:hypothetical protein